MKLIAVFVATPGIVFPVNRCLFPSLIRAHSVKFAFVRYATPTVRGGGGGLVVKAGRAWTT